MKEQRKDNLRFARAEKALSEEFTQGSILAKRKLNRNKNLLN